MVISKLDAIIMTENFMLTLKKNESSALKNHMGICTKFPHVSGYGNPSQTELVLSSKGDPFLACPRFHMLSRWIIAKYYYQIYVDEKKFLNEAIGKVIDKCLHDWGIDKVFTIIIDNASSNDVAISYLRKKFNNARSSIVGGKYLHSRYIAHMVNLIVSDRLKELTNSVARVKKVVRYVRQSPSSAMAKRMNDKYNKY
ncbi:uncharacterized protein LOC111310793 [Durio zibethinus]|uniref:Uncharacterized protein LOC111310788 n=1 Tax=Durio zibethinus TaxID=66656 RepID=A0A6P6AM89_DURZI|nr:uncharacterized protein LOC111310788 [Durio zibethinus]XP_022765930.1 uncharacterized protein LOC111310793 [Durio zibethinus]